MNSKNLTFCKNPWTTLFIDGNGAIHVCAYSDSLSNSYEYNILDIWNNRKIQSIRKALSQGKFSEHCKCSCPYRLNTVAEREAMNKALIEDAYKKPFGIRIEYIDSKKLNCHEFLNGREALDSFPTAISMCFSMACNLRCIFCYNTGQYDKRVSQKTIDSLKTFFPYAQDFTFSGGEPTIEQEFWKVCSEKNFIKYPDWKVGVGTNGFFPKEKIPLMAKYFDRVIISLRAGTKDTYEKLHIGGKWGKLLDNCDELKKEIEKLQNNGNEAAKIVLLYVIMKQNYREILNFFELADKYKSEMVLVRPVVETVNIGKETAMFDYLNKKDLYEFERIWNLCKERYPNIVINEDSLKKNWIDNLIAKKKKELRFYKGRQLLKKGISPFLRIKNMVFR